MEDLNKNLEMLTAQYALIVHSNLPQEKKDKYTVKIQYFMSIVHGRIDELKRKKRVA